MAYFRSDAVGLVDLEGLNGLWVDVVLDVPWHGPELGVGFSGVFVHIIFVSLRPVLQSGIFLEGCFHSEDVGGEFVPVTRAEVVDVGLNVTVGGVGDELLDQPLGVRVKVLAAVSDQVLNLIIVKGSEHEIGAGKNLKDDQADAVLVLDAVSNVLESVNNKEGMLVRWV